MTFFLEQVHKKKEEKSPLQDELDQEEPLHLSGKGIQKQTLETQTLILSRTSRLDYIFSKAPKMRNWIRGEASERPKVTAGGRGEGGMEAGNKRKSQAGLRG